MMPVCRYDILDGAHIQFTEVDTAVPLCRSDRRADPQRDHRRVGVSQVHVRHGHKLGGVE
jgi:hypothetical protein